MNPIWLFVVLTAATSQSSNQRYTVADFADFTKSQTEHVLNIVEQPFEVRSVRGVVQFKNGPMEPVSQVLFEIEGPGAHRKIRKAHTDKHGRFKIVHVPVGVYKFKATLDGYQSSVGTIVVSKKAKKSSSISVEMLIGN